MRVKKLQTGGGFVTFTPIISSVPQGKVSDTRSSSSEKEESSGSAKTGSILNDMVYKELFNTGLSNDVNKLVSDLLKIESTSNNPYLSEANRDASLRMIAKINEIKMSKESWKDAINTAQATGGYGEVAVYRDTVFTKDENNNVKALSLANYAKNKDRIQVLTVADLMNEREKNPNLVGQNQLFNVATNSIGISKIKDEMEALISKLGEDTFTDSNYFSKEDAKKYKASLGEQPTQEELKSLNILNKVIQSPGDYSEITTSNTGQQRQIEKALKYLWSSLSDEKKQKLKVLAIMNNESDPRNFILNLLQAGSTQESKTSITSHNVKEGEDGSGSGSGSTAKGITPISQSELFHGDLLYTPGQVYEFNNGNITLKATATSKAPLPDLKSGDIISPTVVSNIIENGGYKSIIDPDKAFIGDTKINPLFFSEIAYTGGDASKVYLPVRNGVPDLARMEEFNKAYEIYNVNKDSWTAKEAQDFFRKKEFNVKIDQVIGANGKISNVIAQSGDVKPFLSIPIITNSASDISTNRWMTEVLNDQKDRMKQVLKDSFTITTGTRDKPKYIDNQPSAWYKAGPWAEENHPYIGTLFVEYRPDANAQLKAISGNLKGPASTTTDIYRNLNYSNRENNPTSISASADVLNNK